jgi:hypothetical protein
VLVGYARVSTPEQSLDLQRDAPTRAGGERVFEDVASGAQAERPGRAAALAFARPGDTLAVWKLDRLGRSLPHLLEAVTAPRERGVGVREPHDVALRVGEEREREADAACRRAWIPPPAGASSSSTSSPPWPSPSATCSASAPGRGWRPPAPGAGRAGGPG